MRFAFTDDQLAFRDAVADLLAKECPPEVVRAAWPEGTDDTGARPGEGARAAADQVAKVWRDLAEMGVLGVAVSEAHGGLGLAEVDGVLLAEAAGYAGLPHPYVETACVVGPLLDDIDDPDGALPALLDGSRRAAVLPLQATVVPWCEPDSYVVSIDHRAEPEAGWVVRRVAGEAEPVAVVDGGRRAATFGAVPAEEFLASGSVAQRAFDRGALGTAAQLVGLGRRMLDLTVGYVAERQQFGKPVGAQQAVKHHLADAAMGLRFAAPVVYAAAWELATDAPTACRTTSTAKALASDAARATARAALQCHGAIGYTVEYDLHLYLKRAEALARSWGDAAWHRRRVATALGIHP